ncbi:MAG TPA: hypothetical protein VMW41_05500 [Candidatus Bathyarchaeia archaeon]|nr:hypothetical protein [Candidatus Bathyarchaeia archaeon]
MTQPSVVAEFFCANNYYWAGGPSENLGLAGRRLACILAVSPKATEG